MCYAVCVFGEDKAAAIHTVVRSTLATTGIFNSFLAAMHDAFGYGYYEDPDIWWDMSLPAHGSPTTCGASKGGYS